MNFRAFDLSAWHDVGLSSFCLVNIIGYGASIGHDALQFARRKEQMLPFRKTVEK